MKRLLTLGVALVAGMYLTGCAGTARKPSISERSEQTGAAISSYATKTTPVDADKFLISDSEASWSTKNVTFSSLVTTGNSGYALYLSALTDLQILDISTTYTPLVDDTVAYGGTYDAKHVWSIDKVGSLLALKLAITDIDDTAVNGETAAPISSNWAYDHAAATDPHTVYVLESSVITGTVELNTTTVASSGVIPSGDSKLLVTHATATGAATTDSCEWGFVGDPVAKTGFVPSVNGMLSVWCYVDATGYVQVRTSNNTASSITLNTSGNGATIKWWVRK